MIGTPLTFALALAAAQAKPFSIDEAAIERAIENGRRVQASEMIQQAARTGMPAEAAAVFRLEGVLALDEARNGDAFLAFSRSAQRNSADCRTQEGMGLAALRLGRLNAGKSALLGAIKTCPDRWRAWNALGVAYDREGNWTASEAAYAKAAALAPQSALIANNRGYSLILQRRFDEATKILAEASRQTPQDSRIRLNLDIALVASGHPPTPRQATETNDDWSIRLNNAGYVAYLFGRSTDAQRLLSEATLAHSTPFAVAAGNAELVAQQGNEP